MLGAAIASNTGGVDLFTGFFGADIDGDRAGFNVITTLLGAYGAVLAIVPSVVGGLVVTEVIRRRHPEPASPAAVRHDLGLIIAAVASSGRLSSSEASSCTTRMPLSAPTSCSPATCSPAPSCGGPRSSITKAWAGASR